MGDILIKPKDDTYEVCNSNNAIIGWIKKYGNYYWFYPRKDWTNYSTYYLEEIAKYLRQLNE